MRTFRRAAVQCMVALIALTSAAAAQSVLGRTIDATTKHAAESILVELLDSTDVVHKRALTDSTGWFRLRPDRPGTYRLRASGLGYATVSSGDLKLEQALQLELEVTLQPEAVALDPVRVVAERNLRRGRLAEYFDRMEWTQRSGFGRIYTRADIEQRDPIRVSQIWTLGPRADCPLTYFLDGLPMTLDDIDSSVVPDEVEGVEVYRSRLEVPAEYHTRASCGVVLIWLRQDMRPGRSLSWRRALTITAGIAAVVLLLNVLVR